VVYDWGKINGDGHVNLTNLIIEFTKHCKNIKYQRCRVKRLDDIPAKEYE
jgi:hypothetical protein